MKNYRNWIYPVAGVLVQMCESSGSCRMPVTTDENGNAYYTYEEGEFKAQLTSGAPDGYSVDDPAAYYPIVDGEVTVMPAAFGELSEGILNVSRVKGGELTMCRLTAIDGEYYMHMVKGYGKTPMKWEEAGWTQIGRASCRERVCLSV